MAIQLNDRDHLIFNLIDEHKVLLEKHISFFIAGGSDKPVLIRDRLRKLFYLDYLLCERHKDTLPWWTTPTKPLVYTLSPMTRSIVGTADSDTDLSDSDLQRHFLEVANLRMLFLVDEKEGMLSDFQWTTCSAKQGDSQHLDARVTFVRNGVTHNIGIINHPAAAAETLLNKLEAALSEEDVEMVWVISRDEAHQEALQKCVSGHMGTGSALTRRIAFATHQEIYKAGMIKTRWQNAEMRAASIFIDIPVEGKASRFSFRPQIASA